MNRLTISLGLMAALSFICTNQALPGEFSASQVLKIWDARAADLAGVDITYQTSHVDQFAPETPDRHSLDNESRLISYKTTSRLAICGKMMRYELSGKRPDFETGELGMQNYIASYDCKVSKKLYVPDDKTHYPCGFIADENYCSDAVKINTLLLMQVYAPSTLPMFHVDFNTMTVKAENASINDHHGLVLLRAEINGSKEHTMELWLDPHAEYSIRRLKTHNFGYCISQYDCEYVFKAGHWLPSEWDHIFFFPDGSVKNSSKNTVTRQLLQQALSPEDFVITFPAGTVISRLM